LPSQDGEAAVKAKDRRNLNKTKDDDVVLERFFPVYASFVAFALTSCVNIDSAEMAHTALPNLQTASIETLRDRVADSRMPPNVQNALLNEPVSAKIGFRIAPAAAKHGVYVEVWGKRTYGYKLSDRNNAPPICSVNREPTKAEGIATDPMGRLIVPDATGNVYVYGGSGMCTNRLLATLSEPYGTPVDGASRDAVHGSIYIANGGVSAPGNIAVCTLSGGCQSGPPTPNLTEVWGVGLDVHGNLYAAGDTAAGGAALYEFQRGIGRGKQITAYRSAVPGGLDLDANGNLVALDSTFSAPAVYVYTGCPSKCHAHGPFALKGEGIHFIKLNKMGTQFQVGDYVNEQVDVYQYGGTSGVKYLYSYWGGIFGDYTGVAYNHTIQ
jgi:hypothetical protein